MADFNPSPRDHVTIGGLPYTVMPHPAVPSFAFGQEGRKAFVYQLSGGPDQGLYALKKFKEAFRLPELVDICDQLARFARWPGLEVCNRVCLNADRHPDVLNAYPDLLYAVLMPWIGGSTWYDIVIGETPLTRLEALAYANATAQVLAAIEEAGLAHCDISAANVIINPNTQRAHLIDVEDLYAPGFSPPASLPAGTDGYAHHTARDGIWEPEADRFAGAVIIAEMAGWFVPEVRHEAEEEHYFAADEMQQDSPRYRLMRNSLSSITPPLAGLFDAAWFSDTLADAPSLREWQAVISEVYQRESVARVAPEWRSLSLPGVDPAAAPAPESAAEPEVAAPAPVEPVDSGDGADLEPAPSVPPADARPKVEPAPAQGLPAAPQGIVPPPPAPQTSVGPSRPLQARPAPKTGGPVIEWRPLNLPARDPSTPSAGPVGDRRPIWQPPAEAATEEEPEAEAEPETVSPGEIDLAGDAGPESPAVDAVGSVDTADAPIAEDDTRPNETVDEPPAALSGDDAPVYDEYGDYEGELPNWEEFEPGPQTAMEETTLLPDLDENGVRRAAAMGLLRPLLDLTYVDERNRPHLVWSESPGAAQYVLQEDDNPAFDGPREYRVKGSENTSWSPPRLLWRRAGRLYYRIRAEADSTAGPWSEVLQVRIGRE
jgi:hypothetical protein